MRANGQILIPRCNLSREETLAEGSSGKMTASRLEGLHWEVRRAIGAECPMCPLMIL